MIDASVQSAVTDFVESDGGVRPRVPARALITGGAGFIGCNLADALVRAGTAVTVLDNLDRAGSRANVAWLGSRLDGDLRVVESDVRDADAVAGAMDGVDVVYHLAGQTAVTTSILDPRADFESNALGTLNVLEAARAATTPPLVMFASTNKVYGALEQLPVVEEPTRYRFLDHRFGRRRVPPARVPFAVRLLQGRGGPVRPRLRAHLRPARCRPPSELRVRPAAARLRGAGVGDLAHGRGRLRPADNDLRDRKQVRTSSTSRISWTRIYAQARQSTSHPAMLTTSAAAPVARSRSGTSSRPCWPRR